MSDDDSGDDDFRREGRQVTLTLSEQWIERHLFPAYEHCTNVSQAARAAIKDGVDYQEEYDPSISQEVLQDVIEAMKQEGGEVQQTIRIGSAEEVEIENAEDVDVTKQDDVEESS